MAGKVLSDDEKKAWAKALFRIHLRKAFSDAVLDHVEMKEGGQIVGFTKLTVPQPKGPAILLWNLYKVTYPDRRVRIYAAGYYTKLDGKTKINIQSTW